MLLATFALAASAMLAANASKHLLYVGVLNGSTGGEVEIYEQQGRNQRPIGEVRQGIDAVFGLCVDRKRNLYAANAFNGTVTVYAPGSAAPSLTLTGAGVPVAVAVGSNGNVFVANSGNVNNPVGASLLEYRRGETVPSKTIATFKKGAFAIGLTVDSAGDLFVAYNRRYRGSRPRGVVLELPRGSTSVRNLGIHTGHVGEIAVDRAGNLLLVDEDANTVDVFPPGSSEPSQQIGGFPYAAIFGVAINRPNGEIWVTNGFWPYVYGVTYPEGNIVDTITLQEPGLVTGVATSPVE